MTENQSNSNWYLVYTKPKQEQKARQNLENQGLEVLLPIARFEKLSRGKRITSEEPLFPRYIFVSFDSFRSAGTIRSTRGCIRLVQFGSRSPLPVSQNIITELASLANQNRPVYQRCPQKGDQVHIEVGPFRNLHAIFLEPDGEMRSVLLLEMLGQPVKVHLFNDDFQLDRQQAV